ncbi:MAG: hypothetical protein QM786_16745 [Breznakibacter sp.]
MIHNATLKTEVLSILISHASSALRLSDRQIKEKFFPYPICVSDYYEKNERERFIEIRFDDKETFITCTFDIHHRCNSAFILPDRPDDTLTAYVDYLNSVHEYDYIGYRWILSNGYLYCKQSKDGIGFMINC